MWGSFKGRPVKKSAKIEISLAENIGSSLSPPVPPNPIDIDKGLQKVYSNIIKVTNNNEVYLQVIGRGVLQRDITRA